MRDCHTLQLAVAAAAAALRARSILEARAIAASSSSGSRPAEFSFAQVGGAVAGCARFCVPDCSAEGGINGGARGGCKMLSTRNGRANMEGAPRRRAVGGAAGGSCSWARECRRVAVVDSGTCQHMPLIISPWDQRFANPRGEGTSGAICQTLLQAMLPRPSSLPTVTARTLHLA